MSFDMVSTDFRWGWNSTDDNKNSLCVSYDCVMFFALKKKKESKFNFKLVENTSNNKKIHDKDEMM